MPSIFDALRPLKSAATAFFSHDVTLRRSDRGLELALAERSAQELPPRQQQARDRARQEAEALAQMRSELAALLGEGGSTRRTMRALVLFEEAFSHDGVKAVDRVPLPVLKKALEQFESLVSNWSPVGLATLRSKMAVALRNRERSEGQTQAPRDSRIARDSGPSVSVGMQESRQDLEAADVHELELDDAAHLAAAYSPLGTAAATAPLAMTTALPHPQAPSAADDEAAALAAAYAALGGSFGVQAPDSVRG